MMKKTPRTPMAMAMRVDWRRVLYIEFYSLLWVVFSGLVLGKYFWDACLLYSGMSGLVNSHSGISHTTRVTRRDSLEMAIEMKKWYHFQVSTISYSLMHLSLTLHTLHPPFYFGRA